MKEDDGGKIILGDMRILLLFFFSRNAELVKK